MKKYIYLIILILTCSSSSILAQSNDSTTINFTMKEVMTHKSLADATCTVKNSKGMKRNFYSDGEGQMKIKVPSAGIAELIFSLEGYENKRFEFDMDKLRDITLDSDVELVRSDAYMFKCSFYNYDTTRFMKQMKVLLKNERTGETMESYSNDLGWAFFYVDAKQKYELLTQSENFYNKKAYVNTDCGGDSMTKTCLTGFSFLNFMNPEYDPKTIIGTMLLDTIRSGESYQINNIVYEAGKTELTAAAKKSLDDVFQFLKENPYLKIEIASHTDSKGDAKINETLSQKRAEVVVKYLNDKGIKKERLEAKGYGESQLMNECRDGVNCSEEKHKKNRRTEFTVTGLMPVGVIETKNK
jgi:outer membrane protein OmpA-like peptidoglycan-associated protein